MSKIKKLTQENKEFLSKHNLKLKDVAMFFDMKEATLINSTAKNRYVNALRLFHNVHNEVEIQTENNYSLIKKNDYE